MCVCVRVPVREPEREYSVYVSVPVDALLIPPTSSSPSSVFLLALVGPSFTARPLFPASLCLATRSVSSTLRPPWTGPNQHHRKGVPDVRLVPDSDLG